MGERLAGGNVAVALLANTAATAAGLVVFITLFAPISGAHFNPLVTLTVGLRERWAASLVAAYIGAQAVGAALGVWASHLMFDLPWQQLSTHPRSGSGQWLSEAVATFGLLSVVLAGSRRAPSQVPALVGLYIAAAYWFTASTSFANPAVTVARALTDTFAGIRPADVPAFVIAQAIGAFLAAQLWSYLDNDPEPRASAR